MDIKQLIHTLQHTHQLQPEQMQTLLTAAFSDAVIRAELAQAAQQTAQAVFGNKIYIRGLSNSPITAEMTVITAEYDAATQKLFATA